MPRPDLAEPRRDPPVEPGEVDALRSADAVARERAWRALFDANYGRVYRLVCRFGVAPADVEDLVQRAFLTAYRRLAAGAEVRDPGAWLRGIVVRMIASHRRWRRVREAKRWLLGHTPAAAPAPVITPERSAEAAQEMAEVRAVLGALSVKLRDVLVLCDIEECRPAEAAELLGIPVNTVRSRRRLARAKFLALWTERRGGSR